MQAVRKDKLWALFCVCVCVDLASRGRRSFVIGAHSKRPAHILHPLDTFLLKLKNLLRWHSTVNLAIPPSHALSPPTFSTDSPPATKPSLIYSSGAGDDHMLVLVLWAWSLLVQCYTSPADGRRGVSLIPFPFAILIARPLLRLPFILGVGWFLGCLLLVVVHHHHLLFIGQSKYPITFSWWELPLMLGQCSSQSSQSPLIHFRVAVLSGFCWSCCCHSSFVIGCLTNELNVVVVMSSHQWSSGFLLWSNCHWSLDLGWSRRGHDCLVVS